MKAKDIMSKPLISVKKEAPVNQIISLLLKNQISGIPVLDEEDNIIGVISEQDIIYMEKPQTSITLLNIHGNYVDSNELANENRKFSASTAKELMSIAPVCVDENTAITKIAYLMFQKNIRRVFVTRDKKPIGVVTKADLLKIQTHKKFAPIKEKPLNNSVVNTPKILQAKDIMTRKVISVDVNTPVSDIAEIFLLTHITGVPVVNEQNQVIGIISENDLLFGIKRPVINSVYSANWTEMIENFWNEKNITAKDIMSDKVITITEDLYTDEIALLMIANKIKRVPVIKDGQLTGIISRADLLKAFLELPEPLTVNS